MRKWYEKVKKEKKAKKVVEVAVTAELTLVGKERRQGRQKRRCSSEEIAIELYLVIIVINNVAKSKIVVNRNATRKE